MKNFIVFMIFAIGMFAMGSHMSYASPSPPGKVCLIAADGYTVDQVSPETTSVQVFQYAMLDQFKSFELVAVKPPGECTAEAIVQKAPDFKRFIELNYRTCLYSMAFNNQKNKLIQKNMAEVQR